MLHMKQIVVEVRRNDVLSAMEKLMYEYSKPDFQTQLHAMCDGSCDPSCKKAIREELSARRSEIIKPFGYSPCMKGWEKFGEEIKEFGLDPDVRHIINQYEILRSPELQTQLDKGERNSANKMSAQLISAHKALQEKLVKFREKYSEEKGPNAKGEFGRLWKVMRGRSGGGIVVYAGQHVQSTALCTRLESGAKVRELNMNGEQLHFEKVSGKGPKYGWVNITDLRQLRKMSKGSNLQSVILEGETRSTSDFSEASTCAPTTPMLRPQTRSASNFSEASTGAPTTPMAANYLDEDPKSNWPEDLIHDSKL